MSDIRRPKSDKRKDWKDFPTFSTRVSKCHLTLKQVVGNTRFNIANTHYHYTPVSIPVYQSISFQEVSSLKLSMHYLCPTLGLHVQQG